MLKNRITRPPNLATIYWLIEKPGVVGAEMLTVRSDAGRETLTVFSFEEEARSYLRLGGFGKAWKVKKVVAGDILRALYASRGGAGWVALDPIPEIGHEALIDILSLSRQGFMDRHVGKAEPGHRPD